MTDPDLPDDGRPFRFMSDRDLERRAFELLLADYHHVNDFWRIIRKVDGMLPVFTACAGWVGALSLSPRLAAEPLLYAVPAGLGLAVLVLAVLGFMEARRTIPARRPYKAEREAIQNELSHRGIFVPRDRNKETKH